jgi:hypothetical protein
VGLEAALGDLSERHQRQDREVLLRLGDLGEDVNVADLADEDLGLALPLPQQDGPGPPTGVGEQGVEDGVRAVHAEILSSPVPVRDHLPATTRCRGRRCRRTG